MMRRRDVRMEVVAAASSEANARLMRSMMPTLQRPITILTERVDDVLQWCDLALVVSGTATLHVAAHRRPMVALYNVKRLAWWAARWMIRTRTFTLPNLIGQWMGLGRVMPEFVPHFGQVAPIENAMDALMRDETLRRKQVEAFERIGQAFAEPKFGEAAAREILGVVSNQ